MKNLAEHNYQFELQQAEDIYKADLDKAKKDLAEDNEKAGKDYEQNSKDNHKLDTAREAKIREDIKKAEQDIIKLSEQLNANHSKLQADAFWKREKDYVILWAKEAAEKAAVPPPPNNGNDRPEQNEYRLKIYEIDKKYGPKFTEIMDKYTTDVENSDRKTKQAIAEANLESEKKIFGLYKELSKLLSDFNHDSLNDELSDNATLRKALATAKDKYDKAEAAAVLKRSNSQADALEKREKYIAENQQILDQSQANARYMNVLRWSQQTQTPWATYQRALAGNLNSLQYELSRLAYNRAESNAKAQAVYIKALATAAKNKTEGESKARHDRSDGMIDANKDFQTNSNDKKVIRDKKNADDIYTWEEARALARKNQTSALAENEANYDIESGKILNYYRYTQWSSRWGDNVWGWAYDVQDYGDSNIYLVDNHEFRTQLDNDYINKTAKAVKDRAIADSETNQAYDYGRNDATQAYRKTVNKSRYDAANDTAALVYTYRTDISKTENQYSKDLVAANKTFIVETAKAEAKLKFEQSKSDLVYAKAITGPTNLRNAEDVKKRNEFELTQLNGHVQKVTAWAGANLTPWESYQLKLANSAVTHANEVTAARTTQVTDANSLSSQLASSAYNDGLTNLNDLYGNDGSGGIYLQRAEKIANAYVAVADKEASKKYVDAMAGEIKTHDQAWASLNFTLNNTVVDADHARDKSFSESIHAQEQTLAGLVYKRSIVKHISEEEYQQGVKEANEKLAREKVLDDKTRALAIADARYTWTTQLGEKNVTLVTAMVREQDALSGRMKESDILVATQAAEAIRDFKIAEANASKKLALAQATSLATTRKQEEINSKYNKVAEAQGLLKQKRDVAARGEYEALLFEKNYEAASAAHNNQNTSMSLLNKELAKMQFDRAESLRTAENVRQERLRLIESNLNEDVRTADSSLVIRQAELSDLSVKALADIERSYTVALAQADATLYIALQTADATLQAATLVKRSQDDLAIAKATKQRDDVYAKSDLDWVKAVAPAQIDYYYNVMTWERLQEVIKQADKTRTDERKKADDELKKATDSSKLKKTEETGEARKVYVQVTYDAKLTHAESVSTADNTYTKGQSDNSHTNAMKLALANESHRRLRVDADYRHSFAISSSTFDNAEDIRDANILAATQQAQAEATYYVTTAQQAATTAGAQANQTGNPQARQFAQQQTSYAAWVAATAPAYVTYTILVAQANFQADVNSIKLSEDKAVAQAANERRYQTVLAELERQRAIDTSLMATTDSREAAFAGNALQVATAKAEGIHAKAYIAAEIARDRSFAVLDAKEQNPQTNSDRNKATAKYELALAVANYQWATAVNAAEQTLTASEIKRDYQYLTKQTDIAHAYSTKSASALATREIENARAERAQMIDSTIADNLLRENIALANAGFQTQQYYQQTVALQTLATSTPLEDGQLFGIATGYASGNLVLRSNEWNGTIDAHEIGVAGTTITMHASQGGLQLSLGNLKKGVAISDSATGTAYLLYSQQSVHTRFAAHAPNADNSDHLIAVRYFNQTWQYNDDTAWRDFTPTATDLLLAGINLDSMNITDYGGFSTSARVQQDLAQVQYNLWLTQRNNYLQWQADISAAQLSFQTQRANAYFQSVTDVVAAVRDNSIQVADATQARIRRSATLERDYAAKVSSLVTDYRKTIATAEYTRDKSISENHATGNYLVDFYHTVFGNSQRGAVNRYLASATDALNERNKKSASSHQKFIDQEAESQREKTSKLRQAETTFVVSTANLYSNPTTGYQQKLASLEHAYMAQEANAKQAALNNYASTHDNPWARFAAAKFAAENGTVLAAERDGKRDQANTVADAVRAHALALNTAENARDIKQTRLETQQRRDNAAAIRLGLVKEEVQQLPAELTVPVPDMGQSSNLYTNSYHVTLLLNSSPEYYAANNLYFDNLTFSSSYNYIWQHYEAHQYLYLDQGISVFLGWAGTSTPLYHAEWDLNPKAQGASGWDPNAPSIPAGMPAGYGDAVSVEVVKEADRLEKARLKAEETARLAAEKEALQKQINLAQGELANQFGNPFQEFGDESTGFTREQMLEQFIKLYEDQGVVLFGEFLKTNWRIQKGSYNTISLRHDWWWDDQHRILFIGDTDYAGTAYRSPENAAKQMFEGMVATIQHVIDLKEMDLMFQTGHNIAPYFLYTILGGVKQMENAWEGQTIHGKKIEGWERLTTGVIGLIDTVMVAAPIGKAVTAAGKGLGVNTLFSAEVRKLAAIDLTNKVGAEVMKRMVSTQIGKEFLRTYLKVKGNAFEAFAKVYDSRLNPAIIGEKTFLSKAGKAAAAEKLEKEIIDRENAKLKASIIENAKGNGPLASSKLLPILECFAAGTPLLTPNGACPIELLQVGDQVLARDEFNVDAPCNYSEIEEVFHREAKIWELHIGDKVIETTQEHPFYVLKKGWVSTQLLRKGDLLVGHDSQVTPVEQVVETENIKIVYNMRVQRSHTYFVGNDDWGFALWAHNSCTEIVTKNGKTVLRLLNKYDIGSPEYRQLIRFVKAWNEEIVKAGGSMTRRVLTEAEERLSSAWTKQMRKLYESRFTDRVVGHVPDAAAGGLAVPDRAMALLPRVNSYLGGILSGIPVGTKYNIVELYR